MQSFNKGTLISGVGVSGGIREYLGVVLPFKHVRVGVPTDIETLLTPHIIVYADNNLENYFPHVLMMLQLICLLQVVHLFFLPRHHVAFQMAIVNTSKYHCSKMRTLWFILVISHDFCLWRRCNLILQQTETMWVTVGKPINKGFQCSKYSMWRRNQNIQILSALSALHLHWYLRFQSRKLIPKYLLMIIDVSLVVLVAVLGLTGKFSQEVISTPCITPIPTMSQKNCG